jgi:signal transduction histidine kinase
VTVIIVLAVAGLAIAIGVVRHIHRRGRAQDQARVFEMHPTVRLLTTETELRAAVERAVSMERAEAARAGAKAQARIDRYGAMTNGGSGTIAATG